jgi:hypothetical protein
MKLGKIVAIAILLYVGGHYVAESDASSPVTPAPAAFSQNTYPDLASPTQAACAQVLVNQFAAAAVMTGSRLQVYVRSPADAARVNAWAAQSGYHSMVAGVAQRPAVYDPSYRPATFDLEID